MTKRKPNPKEKEENTTKTIGGSFQHNLWSAANLT
jgi:hypothetical protein